MRPPDLPATCVTNFTENGLMNPTHRADNRSWQAERTPRGHGMTSRIHRIPRVSSIRHPHGRGRPCPERVPLDRRPQLRRLVHTEPCSPDHRRVGSRRRCAEVVWSLPHLKPTHRRMTPDPTAGRRRVSSRQSQTLLSGRISIRHPVRRAASRAFCPSRPIASDS